MFNYAYHFNPRHHYMKKILEEFREKLLLKGGVYNPNHPDLVFVFGGDGTMLSAIKKFGKKNAPFMLINDGTLGYNKEFDLRELDWIYKNFSYDDLTFESHHFLKIEDKYGNYSLACNEFLLANAVKTLDFVVFLNGNYFMEVHGSGVCVCSSFGSTGYNHSLGGALFTSSDSLGLALFAPIRNRVYHPLVSSLVTAKGDKIGLEVLNDVEYEIAGDMRPTTTKLIGNEFTISLSNKVFKLAHIRPFSKYQRMRNGFIED